MQKLFTHVSASRTLIFVHNLYSLGLRAFLSQHIELLCGEKFGVSHTDAEKGEVVC
jgi:hypothetical protein